MKEIGLSTSLETGYWSTYKEKQTFDDKMEDEFDMDPLAIHAFTRDFLRIDVGMIV